MISLNGLDLSGDRTLDIYIRVGVKEKKLDIPVWCSSVLIGGCSYTAAV